jgi:protein-arginine kinase activator protein McsA
MYYDDTPGPGGIKGTWYLTSDELCNMMDQTLPYRTHEQKLKTYKEIVDKTPDKWLRYHLDWAVENEEYELAAYIRDIAIQRNVNIT